MHETLGTLRKKCAAIVSDASDVNKVTGGDGEMKATFAAPVSAMDLRIRMLGYMLDGNSAEWVVSQGGKAVLEMQNQYDELHAKATLCKVLPFG